MLGFIKSILAGILFLGLLLVTFALFLMFPKFFIIGTLLLIVLLFLAAIGWAFRSII